MAVAVGACLIALSGCTQQIDTQIRAQVSQSNLIDATITIQNNNSCYQPSAQDSIVLQKTSPGLNVWTCRYRVKKMPISKTPSIMDVVQNSLSGSTGNLTITRNDSTFSVGGSLWLSALHGPGCDTDFLPICNHYVPSVTLALTFPGNVTRGNGTIDGRTITWTVTYDYAKKTELQGMSFTAESGAIVSLWRIVAYVGIGIGACGVLVVLGWLIIRFTRWLHRRSAKVAGPEENLESFPWESSESDE